MFMVPTTLNPFNYTMNSPTTKALMAVFHNESTPKKPYVSGFKVIHIGLDKLHISILETTPIIGHVWKKSESFGSLTNIMRSQISS